MTGVQTTFSFPDGTRWLLEHPPGESAHGLVRFVRPANRFDEFVAHADRLMRARRISSIKDPRVPVLFAMLMLAYPDTLVPGRARDRVTTHVLAGIGRALGMRIGATGGLHRDRGPAGLHDGVVQAPPDVIVNPRTGQRMRFLTQTRELLELESWSAPHFPSSGSRPRWLSLVLRVRELGTGAGFAGASGRERTPETGRVRLCGGQS